MIDIIQQLLIYFSAFHACFTLPSCMLGLSLPTMSFSATVPTMFERFLLIPFPVVHPYQDFLDELIIGNGGLRVNKKVTGDVLISFLNQ